MRERYGDGANNPAILDRLIAESVNLLSVIYAKIYFPTYSNGLKEIAQYLGFHWSERQASGFSALIWRSEWEISRGADLMQKLITYNAEDCVALEVVTSAIAQLCERKTEGVAPTDRNIIHTSSLKSDNPYH
jgi:predicted RecB family nuclease